MGGAGGADGVAGAGGAVACGTAIAEIMLGWAAGVEVEATGAAGCAVGCAAGLIDPIAEKMELAAETAS